MKAGEEEDDRGEDEAGDFDYPLLRRRGGRGSPAVSEGGSTCDGAAAAAAAGRRSSGRRRVPVTVAVSVHLAHDRKGN